jgi:phage-related protein (TIGR01555 family)
MRVNKIFEGLKKRFDSLYDPLTTRGSLTDKTKRTRGRISFNIDDYNKGLYVANGFFRNIVDGPADDATREWIKIKVNKDDEEVESEDEKNIARMIMNRLEELGVQKKIRELIRYSRMNSKGAYLYYGILGDDAQNDLSKKLPDQIKKIDFINIIDNSDKVQITNLNAVDPTKKQYNEMQFSIAGQIIHPSRLSWLVNSFMPVEMSGISIIQIVEDAVKAQDSGLWSVASILASMALKIFTSDEITNLSITQKAELLAKIRHLMDTQSVMALKSDEKFEQLQFNVTGAKEIFDFIFDNLSGVCGIPKNILLGKAHGVVTAGEYDTIGYYANIAKFQENDIKPILIKIIDMINRESEGDIFKTLGENVSELDYEIEFNSLWQLDPATQADVDLKGAQRDQIDITMCKINPAEARKLDKRYAELEPFVMDRPTVPPNMDRPSIPPIDDKQKDIDAKKKYNFDLKDEDGKWITANGEHIFIKEGETIESALKNKGELKVKSKKLKTGWIEVSGLSDEMDNIKENIKKGELGDFEYYGLRWEQKNRDIGDIIENSKRLSGKETKDFPEYGTKEYNKLETAEGVSSDLILERKGNEYKISNYYKNNNSQGYKNNLQNGETIFKHMYIIAGNREANEEENDPNEIYIKNAKVVYKLY